MHYKNGREAKVGDQVVGKDVNGNAVGGILVKANEQASTCNGHVMPAQLAQSQPLVTLADCLHIDDAFAVPDQTKPSA